MQKNGNRIYKVGSKLVELKKSMLDKLREWNKPPYDVSERLDRNIVAALLVACVGIKKLAKHDIEDDVVFFIKSKQNKHAFSRTVFSNVFVLQR